MNLFYQFLNLLFPQTCQSCGEVLLKSENIICTSCILELPKTEIGFSTSQELQTRFASNPQIKRVYSYLKYAKGGHVQELLHNLKYKNRQDIGVFMGNLFGQQIKSQAAKLNIDLLLPIPLHPKKKILRGFNQSDLIAQGLSEILDVPHETTLLIRKKATESQTRKSRIERFENVENVFEVIDRTKVTGRSIGIVDDVLTTGATLEVCASALINAGAKDITIFALASAI
jgi:ComF family protein